MSRLNVAPSGGAADAPFLLAMAEGVFAEHGLDVEWVRAEGVFGTVARRMAARDIHVATMPGPALVEATLQGADLVMVLSLVGRCVFEVIGGRGATSVQDLKGQRVGITSRRGPDYQAMAMALREHALDVDRDVELVAGLTRDTQWKQRQNCAISAYAVTAPYTYHARLRGYPLLTNFSERSIPFQLGGLVVRREFAGQSPDRLLQFLTAQIDAVKRCRSDPALGIRHSAPQLQDSEASQLSYEHFRVSKLP